jgi:hypothetical protein
MPADKQWSKRQRERPERYVGESAAIPDSEGAVLVTSRHGSGMYGAFREEEIERGCWCRTGESTGFGVADLSAVRQDTLRMRNSQRLWLRRWCPCWMIAV